MIRHALGLRGHPEEVLVTSAYILLARASHMAKVNIRGSFQSLAAVSNTTVDLVCRYLLGILTSVSSIMYLGVDAHVIDLLLTF